MSRKKYVSDSQQRIRIKLNVSKPILTDQSDKKSADINNIMLQYAKTGLLPVQQEKLAQYIDNTKIMPLEEAHELIQGAKSMFDMLPAQIRKLMDNDPTKLESFIKDPENMDILLKHQVLVKRNTKEVDTFPKEKNDPAPRDPKRDKSEKDKKD